MCAQNSLYPQKWINYADKDWRRTKILIENDDAEGAAFHLQQALEKYLKGYLLAKGWRLKKIHDLNILISEAGKYNPALITFQKICSINLRLLGD